MDPPEEKRNMDPPEENRKWRRLVTEVVNFFRNLVMIVWTTIFFAFICWVFDGLNDGLDRLERYVLPEYEVLPPVYKPLTAEEYAGLPMRMHEAMRRDQQIPMQRRTRSRAGRRSRPYDDPKMRHDPERDSSPEIDVGERTSGPSAERETEQEGGTGPSDLHPQAGTVTSQQPQGLEIPQSSPPKSTSQQSPSLENSQSSPPMSPNQQSQVLENPQSSPPLSLNQQSQSLENPQSPPLQSPRQQTLGLENPQSSPPMSASQQSQGLDIPQSSPPLSLNQQSKGLENLQSPPPLSPSQHTQDLTNPQSPPLQYPSQQSQGVENPQPSPPMSASQQSQGLEIPQSYPLMSASQQSLGLENPQLSPPMSPNQQSLGLGSPQSSPPMSTSQQSLGHGSPQPSPLLSTSQQFQSLDNAQPSPPMSASQQSLGPENPQSSPPMSTSEKSQVLENQQQSPSLSTSQQFQGLDNPQPSLPLSSSQQHQGLENSQSSSSQYYSLSGMWDPSLWPGQKAISVANPNCQQPDKSSSLKKFIQLPTDSSTSSSVITTDHSENSSSDEAFGTGKDLPLPEPPLSPGVNVDADTIHFSGGAVWEAPSPVQSPPLFSEDDFLKIASGLPVTSASENSDQGLMSSIVGGSPSGLTGASGTAGQQLPEISPPLSPGINVGASTSRLTGGFVLDASPPPVSSPPLFSQDDFEKMMSDLPGTSESGKDDQSGSSLSTDIIDATSNRLSGDTGLETTGPPASSLPSISEGDYARTTSPQRCPSFSKFGDVASPGGTIGYRGSSADTTASLSDVKAGVCTAERPAGAEGGSEIPEVHTRHSRTIGTSRYISLSDEDFHTSRRETVWSDEEIRSSSVENLRSETSKHRRLKFRRRSMPLRDTVPHSTKMKPKEVVQSDSRLSTEIIDATSSHLSGDTGLETAVPSPSASLFDANAGVCTANRPTGAEGGSEIPEVHARHGRTIRTSRYVSLSDEDIHSAPRKTCWLDEEIRSSSVEDLRSETSKHRRLKFRRRSRPLREAVPRSTRIQNLLDRMDVQATEEQVQEITRSTTQTGPNNSKQGSEDDKPEE